LGRELFLETTYWPVIWGIAEKKDSHSTCLSRGELNLLLSEGKLKGRRKTLGHTKEEGPCLRRG